MDWERKGRPKASTAASHQFRSSERDESPSSQQQIVSPPLSDSGRITPSLQTPPISRSAQSYYSELDEKRLHEVSSSPILSRAILERVLIKRIISPSFICRLIH